MRFKSGEFYRGWIYSSGRLGHKPYRVMVAEAGARQGKSEQVTAVVRNVPITVYTYRPQKCEGSALLFVFHGMDRDAPSSRDAARTLADQACLTVYAPLFDKERFPTWSYQRGGIIRKGRPLPREQWTVAFVEDLVKWARREEGRPDAPYYLFGHSAGAQFLSRASAFTLPLDARRIVIANPSTYVLPSLEEQAPFGLGGVFDQAHGEKQLRAYLRLPLTIYLGVEDTGERNLVQSGPAMRQGENRLERGEFAYQMGRSVAEVRGWEFGWRLVKVPEVGHSTRGMLDAAQVLKALGTAPIN